MENGAVLSRSFPAAAFRTQTSTRFYSELET